jgi:hypothetical protein
MGIWMELPRKASEPEVTIDIDKVTAVVGEGDHQAKVYLVDGQSFTVNVSVKGFNEIVALRIRR